MTQSVAVFGRLPAISMAELEALYGADKISWAGNISALLDKDPGNIDFARLGGTVKLAKLLTILDTTDWREIQKYLEQTIPEHIDYLPEGKLHLGLSTYGVHVSVKQLTATGLELKKLIRGQGKSVRLVPNTEPALSSAQVYHNKLASPSGWELLFIKNGNQTILAQTTNVQDIDAYTARDQRRPKRDARVGMLPPKLAQTIVNLACGESESTVNSRQSTVLENSVGLDVTQSALSVSKVISSADEQADTTRATILDPFCGTGVILQEAALIGYDAYGTDLEQRMIDYTRENLDWLGENFAHPPFSYYLDAGDATDFKWNHPFDALASEAYLGQPFTATPTDSKLREVRQTCDTIISKFLANLASQTPEGFRLCLAVPAWKTKNGFEHLKTLDKLAELGYNRVSFVHTSNDDLLYYREGQIVARELLVLERT